MRSSFTAATACAAIALTAGAAGAQQRIPVISLSPASARTTEVVMNPLGVRQVQGGKLLVNDAGRRQVKLFDSSLTRSSVVIDSTPGLTNSYGAISASLIPYLGDSTLFTDVNAQALLVLDGKGQIARTMALPNASDIFSLRGGQSGTDSKGRLLYKGPTRIVRNAPQTPPMPGAPPAVMQPPDSSPILRADLDARRVDTVGRVKQPAPRISMDMSDPAKPKMKTTVNPLPTVDEWAVLSDGSVAFVRGQDYHIDWIHPDGSQSSSAKLPFDWKRLTDEDKQGLIDSARKAMDAAAAKSVADAKSGASGGSAANEMAAMGAAKAMMGGGGGGNVEMHVVQGDGRGGAVSSSTFSTDGSGGRAMSITPVVEFVPLKEIADYYPAIRSGAAIPDLDAHLWILPTTSAQSTGGELVYDVINLKGELFQRVRIPAGRSVIGFGKGGIVYLMSGDRTVGFHIERTVLIGGAKATE